MLTNMVEGALQVLRPGDTITTSAYFHEPQDFLTKRKGASVRKRVEELISIAHPDFRAELKKEAEQLMLW